jgi:hypothetical protein
LLALVLLFQPFVESLSDLQYFSNSEYKSYMDVGFSLTRSAMKGPIRRPLITASIATSFLNYCFNSYFFWDVLSLYFDLHTSLEIVFQCLSMVLLALEQVCGCQGFIGEALEICQDLVTEVLP